MAQAEEDATGPAGFFVMIAGQIEGATVSGHDNLYCDFSFTHGPDWTKMNGLDSGVSQISKKGTTGAGDVVWNLPLDLIYKSTNASGWPRRVVRLFRPVSSSPIQAFVAWLTANRPHFWDPRIVAQGKGREVTRVESAGSVMVDLNVLTRGMSSHGFHTGSVVDSIPSDTAPSGTGGPSTKPSAGDKPSSTTTRVPPTPQKLSFQRSQTEGMRRGSLGGSVGGIAGIRRARSQAATRAGSESPAPVAGVKASPSSTRDEGDDDGGSDDRGSEAGSRRDAGAGTAVRPPAAGGAWDDDTPPESTPRFAKAKSSYSTRGVKKPTQYPKFGKGAR